MLENYVVKLRRDFSCVLVPRSLYFKANAKRNDIIQRTSLSDSIDYYTHVDSCTCDSCNDDTLFDGSNSVDTTHYNDSINGYVITGRSRQAIKNSANSIFFRVKDKTNLRFVTFTFPELPQTFDTKVDEDKFLHSLFLKFLDNERKNYGLKAWLWVNERQSGERLTDDKKAARQVLHYHCLFVYEDYINYSIVNLRFLRLLLRNNFSILSLAANEAKRGTSEYEKVKRAYLELKKGNYSYFLEDSERSYVRDRLGIKRSMFRSPVDFEKIKYSALDIGKISSYISKYCSKSTDKVFCRRWGASRGLVIKEEQLKAFCIDNFSAEVVDTSTGEITLSVDNDKLMRFIIMHDMKYKVLKFTREVNDVDTDFYYVPPNWSKWSAHSEIRYMFKKYFDYRI